MSLPTVDPTTTKAWKELQTHYEDIKNIHLKDLFKEQPDRATAFSIHWKDFYVDYSKNRINTTTRTLLLALAKEVKLDTAIEAYFSGNKIKKTEQSAVLHTA